MNGKTHVAVGVALGLTLSFRHPIQSKLILVTSSAIGSLIPDLDHPSSILNQKVLFKKNSSFKMLFYLSMGIGLIFLDILFRNRIFSLLGIACILIGIFHHRSFTHSLLGIILFSSISYMIASKYKICEIYIGFILGYVLHIMMDLFTPKGVQFFFPLKKRVSLPITIKSNGIGEYLIFLSVNMYSVYLVIKYFSISGVK